ncbi:MAG: PAS domain S-box protein, partial [Myxococcota bacterium]
GHKLRKSEIINLPDIAALPEEAAHEREWMLSKGIRSYLAIPIHLGDDTIGYVDFLREREAASWSDQEVMLGSALRRHSAETAQHQSNLRLEALAEHAEDSICEISLDGKILYASPSFTDICGYTPEELRERDPFLLLHPDDRESLHADQLREMTVGAKADTSSFRMQHRDGRWRWLESTARPFRTSAGEDRIAVVIRDVTSRQESQVELEKQLMLERSLAQLSREFLDRGADEIEEGIRHALQITGTLARADRSWLICLSDRGDDEVQRYEWCAEGIPPRPLPTGFVERERQRWVFRRLAQGMAVRIPRVALLPDDASAVRDRLLEDGVRSFLAVPIRSGDDLIGVLGFHVIHDERDWSDHEISMFQLVAGMFNSALRRKSAEANLRESEARFRALAEHAVDPICEVDEAGAFLYASPSLTDLLGYGRDELDGLNFFSMIHPDDLEEMRAGYGAEGQGHVTPGTFVYRARHKNGEWVVLEGTASVFRGASNEVRTVAILRDVTDRQRAQRALERQLDLETRIAALSRRFLSAGDSELDGTIRDCLADLTAFAETDRSWLFAFEPSNGEMHGVFEWCREGIEEQSAILAGADQGDFPWFGPHVFRGQVIHVADVADLPPEAALEKRHLEQRGVRSFLGIPLHSGDSPVGVLGFETVSRTQSWSTERITLLRLVGEIFGTAMQRLRMEENLRNSQLQLLQAQKMEAVGTLAGGIAHDFNNQLTVMLGNARFVLGQVEDDPELKDALTDLNRAADHCAQLTRSLLAFSRRGAASPSSLSVSEVVSEAEELLRPLIPSSIDFEVSHHPTADRVEADATQLQQVLVNLAVNARDAMADGGSLVITTGSRHLDAAAAARLGLAESGKYVELAVIDTGSGIDDATLARVFEPFFTTKPLGEGTGLGLATAYGIVTECGGAIEVDTTVGAGTTFRVFLPVSSATAEARIDAPAAAVPRRPGTIVVVEDEGAVRRFVQRALERKGFETLSAGSGQEALDAIASHPGGIDAVVTDIDMPRMSGIALARKLAVTHPDLPILFMSGSQQELLDEPVAQEALGSFLQKPFTEEDLMGAVAGLAAGTKAS